MKKIIFLLFIFYSLVGKSQIGTLEIKGFSIQSIPLSSNIDSIQRPKFRVDSVELIFFIALNHLVSEVDRFNLKIGDTTDVGNVLQCPLNITNQSDGTYVEGCGVTSRKISYGNNLFLNFKCRIDASLKWATISYRNNQGITSEKKYFKIIQ